MSDYTHGECAICHERHNFLMTLHGEAGGPSCCLMCKGKWHAEHGRRRKLGRIVIRAIMAFLDGGGRVQDIDYLKLAAFGSDLFAVDPLGYLAGTTQAKDEVIELTSELLADTLRLVHPDVHPPERRELAHRVAQGLLALQPFVFPAPKPKPVKSAPPPQSTQPRNGSASGFQTIHEKPLRYPCPECADSIPSFYCTACRTEFDRRNQAERDRQAEMRREARKRRKARRRNVCAACKETFTGKRKDARFCSAKCRQRAHRQSSQLSGGVTVDPTFIRDAGPDASLSDPTPPAT
jgi:hypothetical protein